MGDPTLEDQWADSRSGAHSGRGYRYQDAVGALDACLAWITHTPLTLTPEGWEDYSVEREDGTVVHRQVKSRQRRRGPFSLAEIAEFINEGWRKQAVRMSTQPEAQFELVLEIGVRGYPLTESQSLGSSDIGEALRPRLEVEGVPAEIVLGLTIIRIEPEPVPHAINELASRLGIVPHACVPIFQAVRVHVGEMADANAARSSDNRARIGLTDLDRIVRATQGIIEPSTLEEAIVAGILEPIDWSQPVIDDGFYEGVDVVPGHVTAGLTVDRPALEDSVIRALDASRFALITGPSGSGKSALAWLAAERRRSVPCYRIRRVTDSDVDIAVDFVKALLPSSSSPVIIVADDLGRPHLSGFDRLARELLGIQGVSILGTVRNENLLLVGEAHRAVIVRPALDEDFASRVFRELSERERTTWAHWAEPLELSGGLLLEYTHILSQGERLQAVVKSQIEDRVREDRMVELQILAWVATASSCGASVPWGRIEGLLEASPSDSSRALRRLVDEHLIVQSPDGILSGLHQLRSEAAEKAVHEYPPLTRAQTLQELVTTLPASDLLPLIASFFDDEQRESIQGALADRLRTEEDAHVWSAALTGLRVTAFNADARRWLSISDSNHVPRGLTAILFNLVLAATELDGLPFDERLVSAANEIRQLPSLEDPRASLIALVGTDKVASLFTGDLDPESGLKLLIALEGVPGLADSLGWPPIEFLESAAPSAPLSLLSRIVNGITRVDASSAVSAVAGSVESEIVTRLETETAWLRNLEIVELDGVPTASCIWVNIVDPPDETIHDLVVEIARTIVWCLPKVEQVQIRAVFPDGEDSGVGDFSVASKRLNRDVLVSQDQVQWNRLRLTAAVNLVAMPSATERLVLEASLIEATADLTRRAGITWLTGRGNSHDLEDRRQALLERVQSIGPPPVSEVQALFDPTVHSELITPIVGDTADTVAGEIARSILPGLAGAGNLRATAVAIGRQINRLNALVDPEYWDLTGQTEVHSQASDLQQDLSDLQAVAFGLAMTDLTSKDARSAAMAGAGDGAMARAAKIARSRAQRRLDRELEAIEGAAQESKVSAEIVKLPGDLEKPWWPPVEVGLLIRTKNLLGWPSVIEAITPSISNELSSQGVTVAPVRAGRMVSTMSGRLSNGGWNETRDAPERLRGADLPVEAATPAADAFASATTSLITISAILAWDTPDHTHPDEETEFNKAQEVYSDAVAHLHSLDHEDPVIRDTFNELAALSERVQAEIDGDVDLPNTLAADSSRFVRNRGNVEGLYGIQIAYLLLLEWDIDSANAGRLLEQIYES